MDRDPAESVASGSDRAMPSGTGGIPTRAEVRDPGAGLVGSPGLGPIGGSPAPSEVRSASAGAVRSCGLRCADRRPEALVIAANCASAARSPCSPSFVLTWSGIGPERCFSPLGLPGAALPAPHVETCSRLPIPDRIGVDTRRFDPPDPDLAAQSSGRPAGRATRAAASGASGLGPRNLVPEPLRTPDSGPTSAAWPRAA
jgi:hypothetical protein